MSEETRDVLEGLEGFTPGPWRTVEVPTSIGTCHRIFPLAWGEEPPTHGGICAYDDRTSLNPHAGGEQLANARLIARAPELVEEIRRLREALLDTLSALDYVVMTDFQDRRYGVGWDRIEKHRALLPPTGDSDDQ